MATDAFGYLDTSRPVPFDFASTGGESVHSAWKSTLPTPGDVPTFDESGYPSFTWGPAAYSGKTREATQEELMQMGDWSTAKTNEDDRNQDFGYYLTQALGAAAGGAGLWSGAGAQGLNLSGFGTAFDGGVSALGESALGQTASGFGTGSYSTMSGAPQFDWTGKMIGSNVGSFYPGGTGLENAINAGTGMGSIPAYPSFAMPPGMQGPPTDLPPGAEQPPAPVESRLLAPAARGFSMPNVGNMVSGLTGSGQLGELAGMASKFGPWMDMGKGVMGMLEARKLKQQLAAIAATQDPFGAQRGQYQQQLSALMKDPSSIMTDPAYMASVQAANRAAAASGYLGSGNQLEALKTNFGNFYNQRIAQLSPLTGAQFGPGNSGAIAAEGVANAARLRGQSLNSLAYGASRLLA